MVIFGILLALLVYLGVDYAFLWRRCKQIEKAQDIEQEHTPTRYIFIDSRAQDGLANVRDLCAAAHKAAQIDTLSWDSAVGIEKVYYVNGDEIWNICYEDAQIDRLAPDQIKECSIKIFVNDKLPKEAIYEVIYQLGLQNYAITVGICKGDK